MKTRVIRARLEGADAEPGRVAAGDVARMVLGLERAIAKAAYAVLGRARRGATGGYIQAVESASKLRFVGTEPGSFVGVLALPEAGGDQDTALDFPVDDLSSLAFERLLDAITGQEEAVDSELASAVAAMASDLGIGDRNTSVTLIGFEGDLGQPPRTAVIDVAVRGRMQRLGETPSTLGEETLFGVLFEADFENNSAELRLLEGGTTPVTFPAELADDIQEALRSRTFLEGVVRYNPKTAQAIGVELRAVQHATQLAWEDNSYWESPSYSDLQRMQGKPGRPDPSSLGIDELTDDERTAFIAELAE